MNRLISSDMADGIPAIVPSLSQYSHLTYLIKLPEISDALLQLRNDH